MRGRCFVDTNIILYAASDVPSEADKHERAVDLLDTADFCVSAQVLQEFYVNAIRKGRGPDNADRVRLWIDRLSLRPLVPTDLVLVEAAIQGSRRYQISYWDAAVVAAAEAVGASILYTEDLNHGQRYGSVLVQNPFRDL
jgi:predicted nucleic acid-binding protein